MFTVTTLWPRNTDPKYATLASDSLSYPMQTVVGDLQNSSPSCAQLPHSFAPIVPAYQNSPILSRLFSTARSAYLCHYGDRAIYIATAKLWNHLTLNVPECDSLYSYKRLLKTTLFKRAYYDMWSALNVVFVCEALVIVSQWLLVLFLRHLNKISLICVCVCFSYLPFFTIAMFIITLFSYWKS